LRWLAPSDRLAIQQKEIFVKASWKQPVVIAIISVLPILAVHTLAEGLKTAAEVMDFSASKTAGYKSWSANYLQTMNVGGNEVTVSGQMIHKQPGKMWLAVDMPAMGQQAKMTMYLADDGILWQIMDMGSQHQIIKIDINKVTSNSTAQTGIDVDPLARMDPSKQWEVGKQIFDFALTGSRKLDDQPMYVMEGSWKSAARTNRQLAAAIATIGRSRVLIGQTDGFPHRFEQYDKSNTNLMTAMEFKNVKFNVDVPDSTFVYKPPSDGHVMDMTPMLEMQLQGSSQAGPPPAPEVPPAPKSK
jgi:outer membrane lipoprotein-sorting protein